MNICIKYIYLNIYINYIKYEIKEWRVPTASDCIGSEWPSDKRLDATHSDRGGGRQA